MSRFPGSLWDNLDRDLKKIMLEKIYASPRSVKKYIDMDYNEISQSARSKFRWFIIRNTESSLKMKKKGIPMPIEKMEAIIWD